jgi:Cu2+-exporting ATPase
MKNLEIEHFVVEGLHCPSCIREIEGRLKENTKIHNARVNLTTQRLAVQWATDTANDMISDNEHLKRSDEIIETLKDIGFNSFRFKNNSAENAEDNELKMLLKSMTVAGFVMMNVMLFSISVWDGGMEGMEKSTRILFHWFSALLVLPAVAYSGRPFFRSAWGALKNRHVNMDVPISLAVLLACAMSVIQTLNEHEHTYYDAAIMLLFFLLIGRYLDRKMRNHARSVAQNLMSYRSDKTTLLKEDGTTEAIASEMLAPNMILRILPGERIPADGILISGTSEIDCSLVTGETMPVKAELDSKLFAGTLNLSGALDIKVTATTGQTLLDEIIKLMETAEQGRAKYVKLADKAAGIYAPLVHSLALLTFLGWFFIGDIGWQMSLITAISVLIITCPCALGLAVPVVQVVASSRLFKAGILVKAGDALERLAEIDTVIFDKTGTLTLGQPELANFDDLSPSQMEIAASLAKKSSHPLCRALIAACHAHDIPTIATDSPLNETSGMGLCAVLNGLEIRLGNREWCSVSKEVMKDNPYSELWLCAEGDEAICFSFRDRLRSDAAETVDFFKAQGFEIILLSGDRAVVVEEVAAQLGIENAQAACKPQDKISEIEKLKAAGKKTLMVGDGLNDAPALSAAYVSISPSSAADVSQNAADFIFQSAKLESLAKAYQISKRSRSLVFSNFALAAIYNVIAVPFAAAGFLTPLVAALAMSGSSIVVTANALRLNLGKLFESKS